MTRKTMAAELASVSAQTPHCDYFLAPACPPDAPHLAHLSCHRMPRKCAVSTHWNRGKRDYILYLLSDQGTKRFHPTVLILLTVRQAGEMAQWGKCLLGLETSIQVKH